MLHITRYKFILYSVNFKTWWHNMATFNTYGRFSNSVAPWWRHSRNVPNKQKKEKPWVLFLSNDRMHLYHQFCQTIIGKILTTPTSHVRGCGMETYHEKHCSLASIVVITHLHQCISQTRLQYPCLLPFMKTSSEDRMSTDWWFWQQNWHRDEQDSPAVDTMYVSLELLLPDFQKQTWKSCKDVDHVQTF